MIREGQANVFYQHEHIASLGPGTMVGEMSLIDHKPRNATVVAETPMKLLAMDTKAFRALLDEMPKARERIEELLRSRRTGSGESGDD